MSPGWPPCQLYGWCVWVDAINNNLLPIAEKLEFMVGGVQRLRAITSFSNGTSVRNGIAHLGALPVRIGTYPRSSNRSMTSSLMASTASGYVTSTSNVGVNRHRTPVLFAVGHVLPHIAISSVLVSNFPCQFFNILGALPYSGSG